MCVPIRLCLQKDICLLHEIEDVVGKQLEAYECNDKEVTKDITKVRLLEFFFLSEITSWFCNLTSPCPNYSHSFPLALSSSLQLYANTTGVQSKTSGEDEEQGRGTR